jgi:hypothetical protein
LEQRHAIPFVKAWVNNHAEVYTLNHATGFVQTILQCARQVLASDPVLGIIRRS